MATKKLLVKIGVVCDLTCPYCWIGKMRLQACMTKLSERMDFRLRWMPYELRPEAPVEGMAIPPEYQNKTVHSQLREAGSALGIPMQFNYTRWPNTIMAHALVHMAGLKDDGNKQGEVVDMLYRSHFTEGVLLSEDTVVKVGQRAGYNPEEVRAFITNKQTQDDLRKAGEENKKNVSGMIPVYFFNGEEMIVGAQSEEEFTTKLILAAERLSTEKA